MTEKNRISLGHIQRGFYRNISKKVFFQEISKLAEMSRGKNDRVSLLIQKNLRQMAELVARRRG